MTALVIDTSSIRTIVGLVSQQREIFSKFHEGATAHAEALPLLVKEALAIDNAIEKVIIGMGPGPFTGLRVGITFAQSFAVARKIPWVGVCSLDGIIIESDKYIIATDARRKELYWARYENQRRVEGPNVAKPNEVSNISGMKYGFSFGEPLYPNVKGLFAAASSVDVREPIYLRKPDAQPTSERR